MWLSVCATSVAVGLFMCAAIPVAYGTVRIDIGFRADSIVEDLAIAEIEPVEALAPVHRKPLLTCLRLAGKRLGLPIALGDLLTHLLDQFGRYVEGFGLAIDEGPCTASHATNETDSSHR